MKCAKCQEIFKVSPEDMDDYDVYVCDLCGIRGDCYLFTYQGKEVVVCGRNFEDVVNMWVEYNQRKMDLSEGEFTPREYDVRKIEHVMMED